MYNQLELYQLRGYIPNCLSLFSRRSTPSRDFPTKALAPRGISRPAVPQPRCAEIFCGFFCYKNGGTSGRFRWFSDTKMDRNPLKIWNRYMDFTWFYRFGLDGSNIWKKIWMWPFKLRISEFQQWLPGVELQQITMVDIWWFTARLEIQGMTWWRFHVHRSPEAPRLVMSVGEHNPI